MRIIGTCGDVLLRWRTVDEAPLVLFAFQRGETRRDSGWGQVVPYLEAEETGGGVGGGGCSRDRLWAGLPGGPVAVRPSEADSFSLSQVEGSICEFS